MTTQRNNPKHLKTRTVLVKIQGTNSICKQQSLTNIDQTGNITWYTYLRLHGKTNQGCKKKRNTHKSKNIHTQQLWKKAQQQQHINKT